MIRAQSGWGVQPRGFHLDSSYLRRLDKGSGKGGSITVWEAGDTFKNKRAGEKVHRVCSHNNLRSRTAGRGCQANHTVLQHLHCLQTMDCNITLIFNLLRCKGSPLKLLWIFLFLKIVDQSWKIGQKILIPLISPSPNWPYLISHLLVMISKLLLMGLSTSKEWFQKTQITTSG